MIMRILLLSAILFSFLRAQTFEWVETVPLDIQTNPAYLHSPNAVDNSGYPVCARLIKNKILFSIAYYGDVEIEKRDPAGTLVWKDTLYGKTDVSDLITDGENNVVCIGTFLDTVRIDDVQLVTRQKVGSFVLKLDDSGNLVWLKDGADYIGGTGGITALGKAGLNNIVLGMSNFPVEAKILTLNSDGVQTGEILQNNIATVGDITADKSGNTWVTGFTFSGSVSFNGRDTIAPFSYNEYVVKYSPDKTPLWITFIQDVTAQNYNLETDNDGSIYLAGNLLDSTTFGNIHANGPQWVYDFFITKIDTGGNFVWLNEIPQGNPLGDATIGIDNFLSSRSDGQTFITGTFRGTINFGNGVVLTPRDFSDLFVLSYGSDGTIKWGKSAGGDAYDQGSSVAADESGNCYLSGLVTNNFVFDTISGTGTNNNLFLSKLKFEEVTSVENGSSDEKINPDGFALYQNYPNPFNPSTKLSFVTGEQSFVSLKVYDVLGKEVAALVNEVKPAGTYNVNFDASTLAGGVYFYRLDAGRYSEVKKMVVVK